MKTLKLLFFFLTIISTTLSFTACNDDDEQGKTTEQWTESDNGKNATFVCTWGGNGGKFNWEFNFSFNDNDICVACNYTLTCPSATLAKETYNELTEDDDTSNLILSDNKIICNDEEGFKGLSRAEVKEAVKNFTTSEEEE